MFVDIVLTIYFSMTCRKCRHEFCWECLASKDAIKKKGDRGHEMGCKYYRETGPGKANTTWPFNVHGSRDFLERSASEEIGHVVTCDLGSLSNAAQDTLLL